MMPGRLHAANDQQEASDVAAAAARDTAALEKGAAGRCSWTSRGRPSKVCVQSDAGRRRAATGAPGSALNRRPSRR